MKRTAVILILIIISFSLCIRKNQKKWLKNRNHNSTEMIALLAKKGEKVFLYSAKGKLLGEMNYVYINYVASQEQSNKIGKFYSTFSKHSLKSYYPYNDEIEPQHLFMHNFSEELAVFAPERTYRGYIDIYGNFVISPQFSYAEAFQEGLAKVYLGWDKNQKIGFINKKGEMVIGPELVYQEESLDFSSFREGAARIEKKRKFGFIDKTGRVIVEPIFADARDFNEELAIVTILDTDSTNSESSIDSRTKLGAVNKQGELIVPLIYDDISNFKNTVAIVMKYTDDHSVFNRKYGMINNKGEIILDCEFDKILPFENELTQFFVNEDGGDGKWGYMDISGKIVIAPRFQFADEFKENLAKVTKENKKGFINKKGNWAFPPVDSINSVDFKQYCEGLAAFKKDSLWGFIDKKGKRLVEAKFKEVGFFYEGLAKVTKDIGEVGMINKKGNFVIPPEYDELYRIYEFNKDFSKRDHNNNETIGIMNKKGEIIISINAGEEYMLFK